MRIYRLSGANRLKVGAGLLTPDKGRDLPYVERKRGRFWGLFCSFCMGKQHENNMDCAKNNTETT
jgi:hypothetical protein